MTQCLIIDIDGTLSPELVTLLNAVDMEVDRVVVTARYHGGGMYGEKAYGDYQATWTELDKMGLIFDDLYMRPRDSELSPAAYKADVIAGLDHEVLLAIDDDPFVGAYLRKRGIPVLKVVA